MGLTGMAALVAEPDGIAGLRAMPGDLVVVIGGLARMGLMGSAGPGLIDLPMST